MSHIIESISSTNIKIIEFYNKISQGILKLSPDFQRKLVWKKQHKYHFIETILKNYPFPEIYIASADIDVDRITSSEVVVDGQQRLSAIMDYIQEIGDFKNQKKITSFDKLDNNAKKSFLNYPITVRDLKDIDSKVIRDIFLRINNTEYSLNAIEKTNAMYGDSELVIFCKQIVEKIDDYKPTSEDTESIISEVRRQTLSDFFHGKNIFSDFDAKRMIHLQYILAIIVTILEKNYFSRNTKIQEYIEKYNESFNKKEIIEDKLIKTINFIEDLKLPLESYWLNRTNLFTLIIEISSLDISKINLVKFKSSLIELENKSKLYFTNDKNIELTPEETKYFEYVKEAVNEKSARIYRANYIQDLLK